MRPSSLEQLSTQRTKSHGVDSLFKCLNSEHCRCVCMYGVGVFTQMITVQQHLCEFYLTKANYLITQCLSHPITLREVVTLY